MMIKSGGRSGGIGVAAAAAAAAGAFRAAQIGQRRRRNRVFIQRSRHRDIANNELCQVGHRSSNDVLTADLT